MEARQERAETCGSQAILRRCFGRWWSVGIWRTQTGKAVDFERGAWQQAMVMSCLVNAPTASLLSPFSNAPSFLSPLPDGGGPHICVLQTLRCVLRCVLRCANQWWRYGESGATCARQLLTRRLGHLQARRPPIDMKTLHRDLQPMGRTDNATNYTHMFDFHI